MPGGKNEPVAIEPFRVAGIVMKQVAEERCADFGASEREPEVAGGRLMDGVHGETTRFIGGASENLEFRHHFGVFAG